MFYKGEKMEGPAAQNTDFHGYGKQIRRQLAKRIPSRRNTRVLDVGTGFGLNAAFLASRVSRDSEIWTVDPSEEVLVMAKKELGADVSNIKFVRASADKLNFEDGFFDVVVSVMVMHHIEGVQRVMSELGRVLKSDGRLLVVDYKPEAAHKLEFQSRHQESDFFEPEKVRAAAEKAGLESRVEDFGLWYLLEARK